MRMARWTETSDRRHVVRDEKHRAPALAHVFHLAQAFLLEAGIAHGQHFVDEQDFRLQMRGHGKGQAHIHAAGVTLYGRVDEFAEFGEVHDLIESAIDLAFLHAQDGAVEEDILAAGQFGMKACAHLQETPHPSA